MVKLILLLVSALVSNSKAQNSPGSTEAAENSNEIPARKSGGYLVNHPACRKDLLGLAKR